MKKLFKKLSMILCAALACVCTALGFSMLTDDIGFSTLDGTVQTAEAADATFYATPLVGDDYDTTTVYTDPRSANEDNRLNLWMKASDGTTDKTIKDTGWLSWDNNEHPYASGDVGYNHYRTYIRINEQSLGEFMDERSSQNISFALGYWTSALAATIRFTNLSAADATYVTFIAGFQLYDYGTSAEPISKALPHNVTVELSGSSEDYDADEVKPYVTPLVDSDYGTATTRATDDSGVSVWLKTNLGATYGTSFFFGDTSGWVDTITSGTSAYTHYTNYIRINGKALSNYTDTTDIQVGYWASASNYCVCIRFPSLSPSTAEYVTFLSGFNLWNKSEQKTRASLPSTVTVRLALSSTYNRYIATSDLGLYATPMVGDDYTASGVNVQEEDSSHFTVWMKASNGTNSIGAENVWSDLVHCDKVGSSTIAYNHYENYVKVNGRPASHYFGSSGYYQIFYGDDGNIGIRFYVDATKYSNPISSKIIKSVTIVKGFHLHSVSGTTVYKYGVELPESVTVTFSDDNSAGRWQAYTYDPRDMYCVPVEGLAQTDTTIGTTNHIGNAADSDMSIWLATNLGLCCETIWSAHGLYSLGVLNVTSSSNATIWNNIVENVSFSVRTDSGFVMNTLAKLNQEGYIKELVLGWYGSGVFCLRIHSDGKFTPASVDYVSIAKGFRMYDKNGTAMGTESKHTTTITFIKDSSRAYSGFEGYDTKRTPTGATNITLPSTAEFVDGHIDTSGLKVTLTYAGYTGQTWYNGNLSTTQGDIADETVTAGADSGIVVFSTTTFVSGNSTTSQGKKKIEVSYVYGGIALGKSQHVVYWTPIDESLFSTFNISAGTGSSVADVYLPWGATNQSAGLRFYANISKEQYQALVSSGYSVAYGVIISPADYIAAGMDSTKNSNAASFDFDMEDCEVGKRVLKIAGGTLYDSASSITCNYAQDGYYQYRCAMNNIHERNYVTKFAVRGYLELTKDGVTYTVYTDYDTTKSRSISDIALANILSVSVSDATEPLTAAYKQAVCDKYGEETAIILYKFAYPKTDWKTSVADNVNDIPADGWA